VSSLTQLNPGWVRPTTPAVPLGTTGAYPWYEEQLSREL
jgi:hypothetical protein